MENKAEPRRPERTSKEIKLGEGDFQQSILLLDQHHRDLAQDSLMDSVMSSSQPPMDEKRPFRWRKDLKDNDLVADYQSRYKSSDQ